AGGTLGHRVRVRGASVRRRAAAPPGSRTRCGTGTLRGVKVEIWSDVVCPWCYIGKRRFESALERFDQPVEIEWKSFELNPDAPVHRGSSAEHLARKYGMSLEQGAAMHERLTALAAAEGLEYHLAVAHGG